jgi:hypothetical protein
MRFTKLKTPFIIVLFLLLSALAGSAQTKIKPKPTPTPIAATVNTQQSAVKSSAAYAEVLLRKTEVEATLDDLSLEFTDEFPKVREARYELILLRKESEKLLATDDASKLTLALGKLIVRKVEIETELWILSQKYNQEHDDVKRAKRKVATYEKAIKEILP